MRFEHGRAKDSHPLEIKLKAGKYKWCACGKTKKVPFCDGTCKGAKAVKFKLAEKRTVELCDCGLTKTPPYCDGKSHKRLEKK